MKIFAIICLIAILIAVQHVVNWALRGIWEDEHEGNFVASLFVIGVAAIITFFAGKYLIIWGAQIMIENGMIF